VRGESENGEPWSARLVLDEQSGKGHFDWLSAKGASGRELVTWSFDDRTAMLRLSGYEMLDPKGNIGVGTYEAELSDDGARLIRGTWGAPALPGTWEATR